MMSEPPVEIPQTPAPYRPTAAQKTRAEALNRYNLWSLYLPLGLLGMALVVLALFLVSAAVFQNISFWPQARLMLSGVADLLMIMTIAPLTLVCALLPAGYIGLLVYMNQEEIKPLNSLQTRLWRLESFIGRVYSKLVQYQPYVTTPIIELNSQLSYLRALLRRIQQYLFS